MREVEGTIERIGAQGDGVMTTMQGRVHVPYTVPGDRVLARVIQPKGGTGKNTGLAATLREVLAPGPERVAPPCPHFHACGGCALQQFNDAAYAAWKRDQVVQALARQGFIDPPVEALARTPPGTRRRADLVARKVGPRILVGLHERASHRIVDLEQCLVLDARLVALIAPLRLALAPLLGPGAAVDVIACLTDNGVDLLFDGLTEPDAGARTALARFAAEQDLARLGLRSRGGAHVDVIVQRRPAAISFAGIAVTLPAGAFVQASPLAEATLVAAAKAALGGCTHIADLFAGLGTFALPLVAAAQVLAVDGDAAAIEALQKAANTAGLAGRLRAETRDLSRRPLTAAELARFDGALFDPPRQGAREQAIELAKSKIAVIVAVSCNPASFARDARILIDGGYALGRVVPVDQFLWSPHIELIGIFRR